MRRDPRQVDLFAPAAVEAPAPVDDRPRDLFGNPTDGPHAPAPRYRPRKPVQQSLTLEPGTFRLD
jgi:hypothetical protein